MAKASRKGIDPKQRKQEIDAMGPAILERYFTDRIPVREVVEEFHISETAFYRLVKRAGREPDGVHSGGRVPHFTPEEDRQLAEEYQQGMSTEQLAVKYNVWRGTIKHALRRAGVLLRRRGSIPKVWPQGFAEQLCQEWYDGMSQRAIAEKYHMNETQVHSLLKPFPPGTPYTIVRRSYHPHWKGGRRKITSGYMSVILETSHPFYTTMAPQIGYVLEHRLVMAESLGRPLDPSETVHHIDGDRSNNIISNLQLRRGRHGAGSVYTCLDCGSHNVTSGPLAEEPNECMVVASDGDSAAVECEAEPVSSLVPKERPLSFL